MVLDPAERFLFSGSADGRIFMSPFDVGLMKESTADSEELKVELTGHKYVNVINFYKYIVVIF